MIKLITLTPLGSFFFGSETTFGQGTNRNYYVRSRLFPQQTSLLGMLRYELLKSAPSIFDAGKGNVLDADEAEALIGTSGFDGQTAEPFGIIDYLSPVFLRNKTGTPYLCTAMQHLREAISTHISRYAGDEKNLKVRNLLQSLEQDQAFRLMAGTQNKNGIETEPYDGKTQFDFRLAGADGSALPLHYDAETSPDGIFIPEGQTGNRKNYEGASDDSGFYKQDRYKLRSGWQFAFLVAFNADLPENFGNERTVQLGAERGLFRMQLSDPEDNWTSKVSLVEHGFDGFDKLYGGKPLNADGLEQMVLLADAIVDNKADAWAPAFGISSTLSFRYLDTHLQDPNEVWTEKKAPKSDRYNLLERGSVFFAEKATDLVAAIEKDRAFRRIGYNYCKIFEKNHI